MGSGWTSPVGAGWTPPLYPRMHLLPKDFIKSSGWAGLLEDLCAPANELEFNRVIRDPAGTGKPAAPASRPARRP